MTSTFGVNVMIPLIPLAMELAPVVLDALKGDDNEESQTDGGSEAEDKGGLFGGFPPKLPIDLPFP
jgi:hypothetical protein